MTNTSDESSTPITPIAGYRPQSAGTLAVVNVNKQAEERTLRVLDLLKTNADVDQRWLAIARTAFEQAYMALNRAVLKPGRVKLPDDEEGG